MGFLELMGHNGTFVKSHTHRAFYLGIGIWNSIQGMSGVYICNIPGTDRLITEEVTCFKFYSLLL